MAIAETARLVTELGIRDLLTPGLAKARGELAATNAGVAALPKSFSNAQVATLRYQVAQEELAATQQKLGAKARLTAADQLALASAQRNVADAAEATRLKTTGLSNALGTFKGRLGGLLGATGLIGLGAGLFSIGNLMSEGISQAKDFGREVGLLSAATGLGTEKTSELAGAFHHFGIETDTALKIAGFAEKNIFRLGGTAKAATDFQAKYGLSLVDSAGHLKDFNTLLLSSADYFTNKSIPAAQKAAALAAIYGRNWQALIPILSAGRQGIADVEKEAEDLGLTLTSKNLADLVKLRDATRDWNTALGGLKLQIGLAIVPALTDLAKAATSFLRNGGREQIVNFFKQLVQFGRNAADLITHQVIPVFKGIYGAWMSVPKELRDLIITGLVANKTIKFLFGVSPLDIGKGLLGTIGGQFFSRGSPTNPMFVVPVGGGLGGPGTGAPGIPAAGGFLAPGLGAAAAVIGGAAFMAGGIPLIFQGGSRTGTIFDPNKPGYAPGTSNLNNNIMLGLMPSYAAAVQANTGALKDNTAATKKIDPKTVSDFALRHPETQKPIIKISGADFLTELRKTSFLGPTGYMSTYEKVGGTGRDPFGEQYLTILKNVAPAQLKLPGVMSDIKGHITELQSLEKYYLSKGQTANASAADRTIIELRTIAGIQQTQTPYQREQVRKTQLVHDAVTRQNPELASIASSSAVTSRKKTSVTVNPRIQAYFTNNVVISATQLMTRVNTTVSARYAGKTVPLGGF